MIGGILTTMLVAAQPGWVEVAAFGLSFITAIVALGRSWNNDTRTNTERITKLESAVESLKEKYQDMGEKIDKIETTVSELKTAQATMDARLCALESKVDKIDSKLDKVSEDFQRSYITLITEIQMLKSKEA